MIQVPTKDKLELEADVLLASVLRNKSRGKNKRDAYPILSDSQLRRRLQKEIPYSNLTIKQRQEILCKNYELDCAVWYNVSLS